MERYSRQIMLPEIGNEGQKKLSEASVLLVGVGGLGSPISLYLTNILALVSNDILHLLVYYSYAIFMEICR